MREETVKTYAMVGGQPDLKDATFRMQDGTTIAPLIIYHLHKIPDVKFAGHSIPHPLENSLLIRLQVKNTSTRTAEDVWKEALSNLTDATKHLQTIFKEGFQMYDATVDNVKQNNSPS